jgi:NodT family efflux transporter outer membrane factor (OMF) lipoprotein
LNNFIQNPLYRGQAVVAVLTFLTVFLTGCADLRDDTKHGLTQPLPSRFSMYGTTPGSEQGWWQDFNTSELNELIAAGFADNPGLDEAWARVLQAEASARKAGAAQLPSLDAQAGAAHSRSRSSEGNELAIENYSAGFSAGYEVDLWSRVRAGTKSAAQNAAASREDLHAAMLSLSSRIAKSWVDLIAARQKEAKLREQHTINKRLLDLIETRFNLAQASALDVYQQSQTIAALDGALIRAKAQQQLSLHQLALLTGQYAGSDLVLGQTTFPEIPPVPPTGFPADLLAQRPDIRAAGLRLKAADWEVAIAKGDRLPNLRLSASFAYDSNLLDTLLDAWLLRLAANLVGPVFDGGRRRAEVERTRAVVDERLAAYRTSVLTAILEVEDALVQERQLLESRDNIALQIKLTDQAYREATWRYLNGLNDFLPVLREQLNLISLQLEQIQATSDLIQARVDLYTAIGGSWPRQITHQDDRAQNSSTVDSK